MKVLATAALAAVTVMAGWAGATPASATTFCVVGTTNAAECPAGTGPGGAFVMTATNTSTLAITGSGAVSCGHATLSGTAPATTTAAVLSIPVTLRYANCTWAGLFPATTTPAAACDATGGSAVTFNVTADTPSFTTLTIPSGCTITTSVPAIACAITVSGAQTIGNDAPGVGGQTWVDGTTAGSTDQITNDALTVTSSGGAAGCPTAGAHGATLAATYRVSTPATAPGVKLDPSVRWRSNKGVIYPGTPEFAGAITAENNAPVSFRRGSSVLTCAAGAFTLFGTLNGTPTNKGTIGLKTTWLVLPGLTPLGNSCVNSDDADRYNIKTCSSLGFTATDYTGGPADTYATTSTTVATGSLRNINCELRRVTGNVLCGTIVGSMPLSYRNPHSPGGTLKPLRLTARPSRDASFFTPVPTGTNQDLTYTDTTRACSLSTGTMDFGDGGFPQGGASLTVTGSGGIMPVIWFGTL